MLSLLKQERRLSYSHWRYRLLHWCFAQEPPAVCSDPDTKLPKFLYTHYCPLFHLTNVLVLVAPFILAVRLAIAGVMLGVGLLDNLASIVRYIKPKIYAAIEPLLPKAKEKPPVVKKALKPEVLRTKLLRLLTKHELWRNWDNFVGNCTLYDGMKEDFGEEVQRIHSVCQQLIKEAEERFAARRKAQAERFAFAINASRMCLKGVFSAILVMVIIFILYATAFWIVPALWIGIIWITRLPWGIISEVAAYTIGMLVSVFLVAYLIVRLRLPERLIESRALNATVDGINTIGEGFPIVGRAIAAPFVWLGKIVSAFADFVSMFYEDNCPPIIIVSEEEDALEGEV